MVSSNSSGRLRLAPEERRAQIVAGAADLALADGLERITLRAVAERLEVRHGLITHYFPVVEDLVVAAFIAAVSAERERLFTTGGTPRERMVRLVAHAESADAAPLARLWLNARHLSRFSKALAEALEDQEAQDRDRLTALIEEGVQAGDFPSVDAFAATVRILIAVDGVGAYVNDRGTFSADSYTHFVSDTAEWALGLPARSLRWQA